MAGVAIVPILIGILRRSGARQVQAPLAPKDPTATSRDGMMLLILAAALIKAVPICLDRHNSATDSLPAAIGDRTTSTAAEATARQWPGESAKGIAGKSLAKELGKRWRFFPTYTEV
jgi:hypothetical protein